jgi:hypothetical protein
MTPEQIKSALTFNVGTVPVDAMREAVVQREAMTPIFLAELERMADPHATGLMEEEKPYIFHIMAMFLLAQFREPKALAPLVRICHLPVEDLEYLIGHIITDSLGDILASVCGNDLAPITSIIENQDLDEFVRAAGLSALVTLYAEGALTRESLVAHLRDISRKLEPDPAMWMVWADTVYDIYPEELMPEIRAAIDKKLLDTDWNSLSDFEDAIREGPERFLTDLRSNYGYVSDPVEIMQDWLRFSGEDELVDDPDLADEDEDWLEDEDAYILPHLPPPPLVLTPHVRETPKVGRNDPCPCGSGKKYKKCCMPE